MNLQEELNKKLKDIEKLFDIKKILKIKIDNRYIQKYYRINKIPYSLFHTKTGFIHMGLSKGKKFKEKDLFGQAKIIDGYIKKLNAKKILELAYGRGANCIYLAKKNPKSSFYGVDLSQGQIEYAYKSSKNSKNLYLKKGDFHELKEFKKETFDIIFIIEALCYSNNERKVFKEVYRILKPKGIMIIFDGYVTLTNNNKIKAAQLLAAKGMAFKNFSIYEKTINLAEKERFKIKLSKDLSKEILPTLEKFEKSSSSYFKRPRLFRRLNRILPEKFTLNAVCGYLLPTLIRMNEASYYLTILKK